MNQLVVMTPVEQFKTTTKQSVNAYSFISTEQLEKQTFTRGNIQGCSSSNNTGKCLLSTVTANKE